jgi:hypothetical protein
MIAAGNGGDRGKRRRRLKEEKDRCYGKELKMKREKMKLYEHREVWCMLGLMVMNGRDIVLNVD